MYAMKSIRALLTMAVISLSKFGISHRNMSFIFDFLDFLQFNSRIYECFRRHFIVCNVIVQGLYGIFEEIKLKMMQWCEFCSIFGNDCRSYKNIIMNHQIVQSMFNFHICNNTNVSCFWYISLAQTLVQVPRPPPQPHGFETFTLKKSVTFKKLRVRRNFSDCHIWVVCA